MKYSFDASILRIRLSNWQKISATTQTIRPELFESRPLIPELPAKRPVVKWVAPKATTDQLAQLRQKWGAK